VHEVPREAKDLRMKKLLVGIACLFVTSCSLSIDSQENGKSGRDDCFTLRDDEYCKVVKK
jgi:hypothetical protein